MLVAGGVVAGSHARAALFEVAITTLLRLFVGIHNAWDAVTYLVLVRRREEKERDSERTP